MRCRMATRMACIVTHLAAPHALGAGICAAAGSTRGFFFVSASYRGRSLLSAATELVSAVKESMGAGRPPHLITLFATPHPEYGAGLADLPQYVRTLLANEGIPPPVVIGGVLRAVAGGGRGPSARQPGVALLAAHLPGVRLLTFHATQGSLPALSGGSWADVLRASRGVQSSSSSAGAPGCPPSSVATLLLSSPHFPAAEELLQRFGQLAPGMKAVGGITAPGAWGESESEWGALWLNDLTFAQGAVGCVLMGAFQLDTVVSPGFRGVGPLMRVTAAAGPSGVWELDGEPVQQPLQRAVSAALTSGQFTSGTTLKLGVGDASSAASCGGGSSSSADGSGAVSHSGPSHTPPAAQAAPITPPPSQQRQKQQAPPHSPAAGSHAAPMQQLQPTPHLLSSAPPHHHQQHPQHPQQPQPHASHPPAPPPQQLVTRGWFFHQGPPRPLLTLHTPGPITPGTPLQVHMQDFPAAQRDLRAGLRAYGEQLPPGVASAEGAVGVLGLPCAGLPFFGEEDVARWLPNAAFAGGTVEGEICSTVPGQPSRVHSYTSCFAMIRAADDEGACPGEAGTDK